MMLSNSGFKGNNTKEKFFFEGTEKLLEIWFETNCASCRKTHDLRKIPRSAWETVLSIIGCQIIHTDSAFGIDGYVLSESSLFVSERRIILKTCGRTRPLCGMEKIIQLAKQHCCIDKVQDVFYSHRVFLRPERQEYPHNSFQKEIEYIGDVMKTPCAAYIFGELNGVSWQLCTLPPKVSDPVAQPDQTLEILMSKLHPQVSKLFFMSSSSSGNSVTMTSRIATLHPGARNTSYLFDPCGYSMNGLLPGAIYYTIHVTPEVDFSYASYETNLAKEDYRELICQVVDIFKPEHFAVTLFANQASVVNCAENQLRLLNMYVLGDYVREDYTDKVLKNYHICYMHFTASKGETYSECQR